MTMNGKVWAWLALILGAAALMVSLILPLARMAERGVLPSADVQLSLQVTVILVGVLFFSRLDSIIKKRHQWNSVTWNSVASR